MASKLTFARAIFTIGLLFLLTFTVFNVGCARFEDSVGMMTGQAGKKEERDTMKEIIPIAQDLATYQPKLQWQAMLKADALDLLEIISPEHILAGFLELSSALSFPSYGDVSLFETSTGKMIWKSPRLNLSNGIFQLASVNPLILLQGTDTKRIVFTALHPQTGKQMWEYKTAQPATAALAAKKGLLLCAANEKLLALNLLDGSIVWSQSLAGFFTPKKQAPNLAVGTDGIYLAGKKIAKFDLSSGASLWSIPNPMENMPYSIRFAPRQILLAAETQLVSLDPASGRVQWGPLLFDNPVVGVSTPEGEPGMAFVITRPIAKTPGSGIEEKIEADRFYCLGLSDGKRLWETDKIGRSESAPLHVDGKLYLSTLPALLCFKAKTGQLLSSEPLPQLPGWIAGNDIPDVITAHGDKIIVSREKAGVAAFSVRTAKLIWAHTMNFYEAAKFWNFTRSIELTEAQSRLKGVVESAQRDSRWWSGWMKSMERNRIERKMMEQEISEAEASLDISAYDVNIALAQSLMGLAIAIEGGIKTDAVRGLVNRKMIEMHHVQLAHMRSIRGDYWVRPYRKRGNGFTIVDLKTGLRADVEFSAPSYSMEVYGINTPYTAILPETAQLFTTGIGLNSASWVKYVKFKWGTAYPSLLAFGMKDLKFGKQMRESLELINAAGNGDLETVSKLLKAGAWIDSRDAVGSTALLSAAGAGHEAVVKKLLASGASVNARSNGEMTAIRMAALMGRAGCVQLLLNAGANPGDAAQLAGQNGHTAVIEVLKKAGITPDQSSEYATLSDAVLYGDVQGAIKFLDQKADPNGLLTGSNMPLLYLACINGDLPMVQLLLKRGARVDQKDKGPQYETALMAAGLSGKSDVVKFMLESGADVHAKDVDGITSLYKAVQMGHADVVKVLLDAGADVEASPKTYKDTPLILAAYDGKSDIVALLIAKGVRIDAKDAEGETALMKASWKGHVPVVRQLLDARADSQIKNKLGQTALVMAEKSFIASAEGKAEVIRILQKK